MQTKWFSARLARAWSASTLASIVSACGGLTGSAGTSGPQISEGSLPDAGPSALATRADKVDLLLDIDNSPGMGDKQAYLAQAIPDLVSRLVTPNCVNGSGAVTGGVAVDGSCTDPSSSPEFRPVRDLHVGIVSSSLGPRLGDVCDPAATQTLAGGGTISRHDDDQAHLLNRSADPNDPSDYAETPLGAAPDPYDFLNWFPAMSPRPTDAGVTAIGPTAITVPAALETDLESLVVGVHAFGCGIESQLESWYRFLIQPDPYASLTRDDNGRAQWAGVDTTILAQRADFLRPDSLVVILVLTDEDDSEVDVRSNGGTGWNFMSSSFDPPRGTSLCATKPGDPGCVPCSPATEDDPSCQEGPYSNPADWGYDLNLRHAGDEKQKYGESFQFPIQRYVIGLTSPKVPDRNGEYPPTPGAVSGYASSYQGLDTENLKCTNPLYASELPRPPSGASNWNPTPEQLCNLAPGARAPSLVYYAHIGGVPHQLLQQDPSNPDSPQKDALTDADWTLILGKDPPNFDYSGRDPHMVESVSPRTQEPVPPAGFPVAAPTAPEGTDPISGREFVTETANPPQQGLVVDIQYACTFKLTTPRECGAAAVAADPTLVDACTCPAATSGEMFSHDEVPAVCNDATPSRQDYDKAYPTLRELALAQLVGKVAGANEGIVSSICPIHTVESEPGDPLYGYRPAMTAIVDRLKKDL